VFVSKQNQRDERRRLEQAGCFVSNNLVYGKFPLSRCLGSFELKKIEEEDTLRIVKKKLNNPWVINDADVRIWELNEEDEYIFMSTSGLFEVLSPQEILTMINLRIRNIPLEHPKDILNDVFTEYFKRGGMSNASAILIDTLSANFFS
jgi:serine/threonine protein phosphatase PrpC